MPLIKGKILLKTKFRLKAKADIFIRILDSSLIDKASVTIAEICYNGIALEELSESGFDFKIALEDLDLNRRYEVSVLVDLDGDGKTGKGDYINKQSYPVLTKGYPDFAEVIVSEV